MEYAINTGKWNLKWMVKSRLKIATDTVVNTTKPYFLVTKNLGLVTIIRTIFILVTIFP